MISYLDVLFFLGISVVGAASFAVAISFVMDIGAKEKTYYKIEDKDTYVVYKWFRGRIKGCYTAYKFKKEGNNVIFLKRKITISDLLPYMIVLGIFFIIYIIKAGLLAGIGVLLCSILVSVEFAFVSHQHNVLYCRRFLIKKLKC